MMEIHIGSHFEQYIIVFCFMIGSVWGTYRLIVKLQVLTFCVMVKNSWALYEKLIPEIFQPLILRDTMLIQMG